MPIPDFDHNNVIPPHLGNPTIRADLSPYECSTLELCQKFATSNARKNILGNFLLFRQRMVDFGVKNAFHWIDGSFLENVEVTENRDPSDLDVVTLFWGLNESELEKIYRGFPEFFDFKLSKTNFLIDHYPFDFGHDPIFTVEYTRYWIQLFTHNRNRVWKGMLKIPLGTADIDAQAQAYLRGIIL